MAYTNPYQGSTPSSMTNRLSRNKAPVYGAAVQRPALAPQSGAAAAPVNYSQALTRQNPLTQGAQIAETRNVQQLQTGTFAPVQSAQNATARANAQRTAGAAQRSMGLMQRNGMSAAAALRAQETATSAAEAQNLEAQNQVNALQRQYGQDALDRADLYENRAQDQARHEQGFQAARNDEAYNRFNTDRGFDAAEADKAYGRDMDEREYYDRRADVEYGRDVNERGYQDSRSDLTYERDYKSGRDRIEDTRYDTEYGDKRADINYNRDYTLNRDRVEDTRYDREYGDKRGDVAFERNYKAGRDRIEDTRYDKEYGDKRGDLDYSRKMDYINSVGDEKAKQAMLNDAVGSKYNSGKYFERDGSVKKGFRSMSPAQLEMQAEKDKLATIYPNKSSKDIEKLAYDNMRRNEDLKQQGFQTAAANQGFQNTFQNPIDKVAAAAAKNPQQAAQQLRTLGKEQLQAITKDPARMSELRRSGVVKTVDVSNKKALLGKGAMEAAYKDVKPGQVIEINGKLYEFEKHESDRWTKFGNTRRNGKIIGKDLETGKSGLIWQTGSMDVD